MLRLIPLLSLILFSGNGVLQAAAAPPHLVVVLADDLGYGDLACTNPAAKVPTPTLDRLARAGTVFTDAHSGSAVCTPTRYGLLTGRYAWRSTLQRGVLTGPSPALIPPDRITVARFLQQRGYHTVCIGKWHLGLNWSTMNGEKPAETNLDYATPLRGGPRDLGFDAFFGIPASLDMPPYVYVQNDRVVAPATATLPGDKEYAYYRPGPAAPGFDPKMVLPELTARAVDAIDTHAQQHGDRPLFLYFALPAPHTPILPADEFQGRSGINPYADFLMQVDDTVAELMHALERHAMAGNTLFIFTSDNGPSPYANFKVLAKAGHDPKGGLRGAKADLFEGGHRVPFIAHWPERIPAGQRRKDTICLTDYFATVADLLHAPLPANAAEDSFSFLPALEGKRQGTRRTATVHHSANGCFAIRSGRWKLLLAAHSGGWSEPTEAQARTMDLPPLQLYDLLKDPRESQNVYEQHPRIVRRMTRMLEMLVAHGRSTPGPPQNNDRGVTLYNKSE